jgi:hypothetical protein
LAVGEPLGPSERERRQRGAVSNEVPVRCDVDDPAVTDMGELYDLFAEDPRHPSRSVDDIDSTHFSPAVVGSGNSGRRRS